jgi:hypothetical protein
MTAKARKKAPAPAAAQARVDPNQPRWIEYIPLADVKGNPKNAKEHDVDEIRASIKRFDFTSGVMLDERTGMLVAGHGRVEVLRTMERGNEEVPPGILVDPRGWLLPVQRGWSSKDDDEALAYTVADNRISEIGGWDEAKLAAIVGELQTANRLTAGVGISEKEAEKILADVKDKVAVREVETKVSTATFWVTCRGPVPAQADVLDLLKAQLKGIPGITVEAGILTGGKK